MGAIAFVTSKPQLGYDPEYYDTTYWENGGETWQAQFIDGEWVYGSASFNIELFPTSGSTWADGFRPPNIRIYTDEDWSLLSGNILIQTGVGGDTIGSQDISTYTSGSNISLDTGVGDIGRLYIPGSVTITQIEFDIPAAPTWQSVFDDTYWQNQANSAWDGTKWVASGPPADIDLRTKLGEPWPTGFRPTKARVTGSWLFGGDVRLRDGLSGNTIGSGTSAGPTTEIDLDFSSAGDMVRFNMYGYTEITNIEFLGGTLGS